MIKDKASHSRWPLKPLHLHNAGAGRYDAGFSSARVTFQKRDLKKVITFAVNAPPNRIFFSVAILFILGSIPRNKNSAHLTGVSVSAVTTARLYVLYFDPRAQNAKMLPHQNTSCANGAFVIHTVDRYTWGIIIWSFTRGGVFLLCDRAFRKSAMAYVRPRASPRLQSESALPWRTARHRQKKNA